MLVSIVWTFTKEGEGPYIDNNCRNNNSIADYPHITWMVSPGVLAILQLSPLLDFDTWLTVVFWQRWLCDGFQIGFFVRVSFSLGVHYITFIIGKVRSVCFRAKNSVSDNASENGMKFIQRNIKHNTRTNSSRNAIPFHGNILCFIFTFLNIVPNCMF